MLYCTMYFSMRLQNLLLELNSFSFLHIKNWATDHFTLECEVFNGIENFTENTFKHSLYVCLLYCYFEATIGNRNKETMKYVQVTHKH